jgi:hypothetical protein
METLSDIILQHLGICICKDLLSGMEFTYVRLQHFIPSECFLSAKERSLISCFSRKPGNPFTFYWVRQVILYSRKFDSCFYILLPYFTLNCYLCILVRAYMSVCFWLGYIIDICFVIYTFGWFICFLFGWIIGCMIGFLFVNPGFLRRFVVELASLLVGWSIF